MFHQTNSGVSGAVKKVTIRRAQLRPLLDRITNNPTYIFRVECKRRTDLFLTYPPRHDLESDGGAVHVGDHSIVANRQFIKGSRRRIVLQPKGTVRTMTVKRKTNADPTKHWQSKGKELRFDPAAKGLYLVYAMYRDQMQDFGTGRRFSRHGQYRSWCFIDLRTTSRLRYSGVEYEVAA